MDFEPTIKRDLHEPLCDPDKVSTLIGLDHLPGVATRDQLDYSPELGLKEVCDSLNAYIYLFILFACLFVCLFILIIHSAHF